MDRQTFVANDVLFHEGDDAEVAYLVESGTIEISVKEGDDKQVLGTVEAGGLFGEMALISNLPRMATATAASKSVCVVIHQKVLKTLIEQSDPLMSALLLNLIGNVRSLNDKLGTDMGEDDGVQYFSRGKNGVYERSEKI